MIRLKDLEYCREEAGNIEKNVKQLKIFDIQKHLLNKTQ